MKTRYTLGPGQEREGSATCEAKWMLNGHVLQQEYWSFTIEWFLPDAEGKEQRMVLLDHTRKAP